MTARWLGSINSTDAKHFCSTLQPVVGDPLARCRPTTVPPSLCRSGSQGNHRPPDAPRRLDANALFGAADGPDLTADGAEPDAARRVLHRLAAGAPSLAVAGAAAAAGPRGQGAARARRERSRRPLCRNARQDLAPDRQRPRRVRLGFRISVPPSLLEQSPAARQRRRRVPGAAQPRRADAIDRGRRRHALVHNASFSARTLARRARRRRRRLSRAAPRPRRIRRPRRSRGGAQRGGSSSLGWLCGTPPSQSPQPRARVPSARPPGQPRSVARRRACRRRRDRDHLSVYYQRRLGHPPAAARQMPLLRLSPAFDHAARRRMPPRVSTALA